MRLEFESRWTPLDRPAVAEHRTEIAARIADCEAVAVAGGHVATLLNRLVLFGIAEMPIRTLFAWSAGAMALTDRVVLFHDDPPQGQGESEVLEEGLGLCPRVVVFPHWRRRLKLEDPERGSLLAKRFEPASCLAMEDGSHVTYDGTSYGGAVGVLRIKLDGAIGGWS
jgi:hypothetical protein